MPTVKKQQGVKTTLSLRQIIQALVDRAGGEQPLSRLSGIERYTFRRILGKNGGLKTFPTIETFDKLEQYLQRLDEEGDPLIINGDIIVLSAHDLLQLCRESLRDRSDRIELLRLIDRLDDDQVTQLLGVALMVENGNGQELERLLNASTVSNLALAFQQNLDIRFPGLNRLEQVRAFAASFGDVTEEVIQDLMLLANFQQLPSEPYPVLTVLAKELKQVTPRGLGATFGRNVPEMLRFYGIAE